MSIDIKIPGYDLIEEIGAGGMAKVYLGIQVLLERKVAIKILHQRLSAESEEFKQRFFTEGRVLAKLQHDNIVSIIDIGEADGMLYMAMEYVENGTLTDWLKKQEVTVDQAIQICSKVGLALHAVGHGMKPALYKAGPGCVLCLGLPPRAFPVSITAALYVIEYRGSANTV